MMARWNLSVYLSVSLFVKETEHFYISLFATDSSFLIKNMCSDELFLNYWVMCEYCASIYEHICKYVWQSEFCIKMYFYVASLNY